MEVENFRRFGVPTRVLSGRYGQTSTRVRGKQPGYMQISHSLMKSFLFSFILFGFQGLSMGQLWSGVGGGVRPGREIRNLYVDNTDNYLYACGSFYQIGENFYRGIARWDGAKWDSLGGGVDGLSPGIEPLGWAFCMERYHDEIIVGGAFHSLGNANASKLGRWNGNSWSSFPGQPFALNDYIGAVGVLKVINDDLYIGGTFDSVAGLNCNGIAKWTGTNWSSVHDFPSLKIGYVFAIEEFNNELYVAGNFYEAGSDTLGDIIRWDGHHWRSVGGGIKGLNAGVNRIINYNGSLYVGGYFLQSDGNAGNHIMRWDGNVWQEVDGGTWEASNGSVWDMEVFKGELYVVGQFFTAGNIPANRIAKWDGSRWCSFGSFFDNTVGDLSFFKDTLYIAGGFRTINGDSILQIAKWLGGDYVDSCNHPVSISKETVEIFPLTLSPNPTSGEFHLSISAEKPSPCTINIYDALGQKIKEVRVHLNQGENKVALDLSGYAKGMYMVRVEREGRSAFGKVVLE